MKTTSRLFLCLFCLTLPLASGYANEGEATVQTNATEQERKAGERMTLTIKDVEYAFRWCPAGTFMMGSSPDPPGWRSDKQPHQVTLLQGFWMLETEVTQAMWESVMGKNPSHFKGTKLPVESVSWDDCQEYIKKMNALLAGAPGAPAGLKFSLPTEAQWEYACRAGTATGLNNGKQLTGVMICTNLNKLGWYRANSKDKTHDVGQKEANAWGLRDMHGNVGEWCSDWYDDRPGGAVTDLTGALQDPCRVVRGGTWFTYAELCVSAGRHPVAPLFQSNGIGFRLSLVYEE